MLKEKESKILRNKEFFIFTKCKNVNSTKRKKAKEKKEQNTTMLAQLYETRKKNYYFLQCTYKNEKLYFYATRIHWIFRS